MKCRESFDSEKEYQDYLENEYYSGRALIEGLSFLLTVLVLLPLLIQYLCK
jgi:hypothetical protein